MTILYSVDRIRKNVKDVLSAPDLCSEDTIDTVRRLLSIETVSSQNIVQDSAKPKNRQEAVLKSRRTPKNSQSLELASNGRGDPGNFGTALDNKDKYTLAIELINVILQTLSVIETSLLNRKDGENPPAVDLVANIRTMSLSSSTISPDGALRQRSTNHTYSTCENVCVVKKPVSKISTTSYVTNRCGIVAIAECGKLAFECLKRQPYEYPASTWQLESGMIAFISRLIACGITDLAAKQLQALKRHLTIQIGVTDCSNKSSTVLSMPDISTMSHPQETLASLLHFERLPDRSDILAHIINHQILVLKLTLTTRRPAVIEALCEDLETSSASSPINILLRFAKLPGMADQAASQMEVVAQLILSLCQYPSGESYPKAIKAREPISAENCLRLQTAAFEAHVLWRHLARHHGNVESELLRPFLKCMTLYMKNSSATAVDKYHLLATSYNILKIRIDVYKKEIPGLQSAPRSVQMDILLQIGRIAQIAGLWEQAEQFAQDLFDMRDSLDCSEIRKSVPLIRLAAISLYRQESIYKREKVRSILQLAATSINMDNPSTIPDLLLLLHEFTNLRNAVVSSKTRSLLNPLEPGPGDCSQFDQSCHAILDCKIRFVLKCLHLSQADKDAKTNLNLDQLRQKALEAVRPSVESILLCHKVQIIEKSCYWTSLDASLQNCLSLLQFAQTHGANRDSTGDNCYEDQTSMHIKLSQYYWNLYVTNKATNIASTTLVLLLKRSCECLAGLSYSQQEAGHLPLKLTKLGQLLETRKEYHEAKKALVHSIETSLRCGALSQLSDDSKSDSARLAWPNSAGFTLLCQTMERLLLLHARDDVDSNIFYDDDQLTTLQRVLILEWQLRLLAKDNISTSLKALRGSAVPRICQLLFDIYMHDTNPGRRWRVALSVLQLATEEDVLFNNHFVIEISEKLGQECILAIDRSSKQWAELEHLRASLMVALAFRNSKDCTSLLKEALAIWTGLVNDETSRLTSVIQKIEDVDGWILQLQQVADFYDMQCLPHLQILTLHLLLAILTVNGTEKKYDCGFIQLKLSVRYVQLGYLEEAGIVLMKVRESIGDLIAGSEICVSYHLAHIEYYISIGNLEKCKMHFAEAEQCGAFEENIQDISTKCSLHTRVAAITRISQHLCTKVHFLLATAPHVGALYLAKRNVDILQRIWKSIESYNQSQNTKNYQKLNHGGFDVENVRKTMSTLTITPDTSKLAAAVPQKQCLHGSAFWQFAPVMYRSFLQLSAIYYHYGMFQESMHLLQQVQQLGDIFQANPVQASILTRKGDYSCRSGSMQDATQNFEKAAQAFNSLENSVELARYHVALGYSHHLARLWTIELEDYNCAEKILDTIISSKFVSKLAIPPSPAPTPDQPKKVMIRSLDMEKRSTRKNATAKIAGGREIPSKATRASDVACPSNSSAVGLKFGGLRTEISRRKAELILVQGDARASLNVANNTSSLSMSPEDRAHQRTTMAKILISTGLKELSLDAVFSMLPESTVTFPAVVTSNARRSSSHTIPNVSPGKKPQKGTLKRAVKALNAKLDIAADLFSQAMYNLSDMRSEAVLSYSNHALKQMSAAFTHVAMLLCFVQPDVIGKTIYPALLAYSIDLPQSMMCIRERVTAASDSAKYRNANAPPYIEPEHIPLSLFQSDMIDIIPENWTAVSISLDESQEHMYLVKYQAQQSPFLLRLPLNRQDAEDPNEETFTFVEAKEELQNIIKSSDATVHAVQESPEKMSEKGAKTKWWADREALDERLKNLLINVETVWLGGFRGILSQSHHDPSLLARFQQSFNIILDKYLPSRHHKRGRNDRKKVQLSPRIFELFTGLAYPSDGNMEMDEALTDLLYYVVDILQFNGECNAYDEIDFDAMIVETQDALQSYHEGFIAENPNLTPHHTILILDKQLHAFPWESMPCLESQSVSRVSSLYDLRERILFLRQQQNNSGTRVTNSDPLGIITSPLNGTYILNPSADLSKTQSRFQTALSDLGSTNTWHSIIGRAPTEEEFATALKPSPSNSDNSEDNNNISLYFGHGSGAQYIRPRRIKRLAFQQEQQQQDSMSTKSNHSNEPGCVVPVTSLETTTLPTCNTTLLFGCSSAALRTAGEFNNYGPPTTYLIAGAPAVLGSLWDVTDGDCDVFAAATLEGWGLLPAGSCVIEEKGRGRKQAKETSKALGGGKAKGKTGARDGAGAGGAGEAEDMGENWGKLCLSEAAARARRKCYLKYLNGAAMVVYGVPVFIDRKGK